ncbi:MAG: cell division protein FtsW [Solirubrobacteraceae bacterium]|jgi:cell division protein FtsW|nr:cell division protein FtsW [Solirubrobacteraceae bacterium]MEA2183393.1 cell division protein FtsW [Solirubrobacteraceae bacterium]MEA2185411.1 cell division protein FtsW [Solirubrobacteraceae bacterium]
MASVARPRVRAAPKSRRKPKPVEYNILLTATLCLLAAGAVMVYSASSARTLLESGGDGTGYLVKYVTFGAVGLVILQVLARGGLDLLSRVTPALLGISFLLLLAVKIPGIGVEVNGARRWLGAGSLQFQPSELMKLALVLYAAGLLATTPSRLRNLQGVAGPLLLVGGAAILLIASQPDLGSALVIAFTLGALLLVAGTPLSLLAKIAGVGAVLVLLFILIEPYRAARLTAFINPWAHADSVGFQSVQGQIAVGSGGLFGVGLGESVQKVFYLPEAHTDFILAVIGEELGVAGICGLLFLYGLIGYAGLRTAKAATTRYQQLLAAGLTALILCQALLNVCAVLGLAPLTGVPLPFISSGSSSLIVMLATMGVLLNLAARNTSHLMALTEPAGRRDDARGSPRAEGPHRSGRDGRSRGARAGGR